MQVKLNQNVFIIFVIIARISSPHLHPAKSKSKHCANPVIILFVTKNKWKSGSFATAKKREVRLRQETMKQKRKEIWVWRKKKREKENLWKNK